MKNSNTPSIKPHLRWDNKNARVGLIVLAVLLIAGLTWYFLRSKNVEPESKFPQYSEQQLVIEVNKSYGKNDYIGAIRLIEGQKTIKETNTQLLLAGAYANSGDDRKALDVYDKLESENKLGEADTGTAGDIAARLKDYGKAKAYYLKAKDRSDGNIADQKALYDYKIAELEKKK